MPYPPFPFSYLPDSVKRRLKDYSSNYANNNPYADIKMPGSMMPGSAKNPFVSPYAGPPEYSDGFEIVPENAIPLSSYKLQNIPSIVKNIEDVKSPFASYGDMNKEGVLLQKDISTPEYDQMTGNVQTPYVMDYTPFASEEEMNNFYNPAIQEAEIVGKYSEPIGPKNYTYQRLGPEPYEYSKEPIGPMPYEYSKEPIGPKPFEYRYDKPIGPEPFEYRYNEPIGPKPFEYRYDKPIGPEPFEYEKTSPNTETNSLTQTPKNKFGTPEAYYLGKSMLDATALINNMVQPQPPSLQMKIPHYERQRLDPTPYDAMRSQMRDQGTQAYRLQRENISQASDLMKGLAAVTSGTQQGLMQVGMQQAGAEQQIQGINQQISMQEQGQQTEMLNQEAMTNYQMQQQAQQFKDQMVSAQLNRLGDTAGAYSDYVVKKELAQKMTDMSKDQADKGNAIQIAMLKYQAGQNELGSDAFKEAQRQNINQYISETKSNLYKDPRYDKIRQKYGDNYDPLTLDTRESNIKNLEQRMNILSESYNGFTEEPQKPTRTAAMTDDQWKATEEDYEKRKWRFDSDKERYTTAKKQYDLEKPIIDLERSFVNELKSSYDVAGRRNDFQSEWFKKRGLKTMQETIEEVETLMNPNRQIFK